MIKEETFYELLKIVPRGDVIAAISMQTILYTTDITTNDMVQGNFSKRIQELFTKRLLGGTKELARRALNLVLACNDYQERKTCYGIGGYMEKTLQECIDIQLEIAEKEKENV